MVHRRLASLDRNATPLPNDVFSGALRELRAPVVSAGGERRRDSVLFSDLYVACTFSNLVGVHIREPSGSLDVKKKKERRLSEL